MIIDVAKQSLQRHPIFTEAELMHSCINELKAWGFNHFSYLRLINANQRILLTTSSNYAETFIKNKFYKFGFCGTPESYNEGLFLHDYLELGDIRTALAASNIHRGFVIIKKQQDCVEQFIWGSSEKNSKLNHFIINNTSLFNGIIETFRHKAKRVLKNYEQQPLYFPLGIDSTGLVDAKFQSIHQLSQLFTPREIEILQLLKQGLSNKKIGNILNISSRTIEKHFENMFIKAGTHSRIELLREI